jgi:hypothetical protein
VHQLAPETAGQALLAVDGFLSEAEPTLRFRLMGAYTADAARGHPREVLAAAIHHLETPSAESVAVVAYSLWAQSAPDEASEYLNTIPASPIKDTLIQAMIGGLHREMSDAEKRVWVDAISSPKLREKTASLLGL